MGLMKDIFGPSKDEVWESLCNEIGGEFISGGFWKGSKVVAKAGEWTIVLDTYTVSTGKSSTTYTRMRAPYINPEGFRFKIYNAGIFTDIGKWFGMQDINIGVPHFDDCYVIKGNNEDKVKQLLSNESIRELLEIQPSVHFEVKDDEGMFGPEFPEGVDELYFQVMGVVKDVERLKNLYNLFIEILNHLCHIGSAYMDNPNMSLI